MTDNKTQERPTPEQIIEGKGIYAWNSVYHHYNRVSNYEILFENDITPLTNIQECPDALQASKPKARKSCSAKSK